MLSLSVYFVSSCSLCLLVSALSRLVPLASCCVVLSSPSAYSLSFVLSVLPRLRSSWPSRLPPVFLRVVQSVRDSSCPHCLGLFVLLRLVSWCLSFLVQCVFLFRYVRLCLVMSALSRFIRPFMSCPSCLVPFVWSRSLLVRVVRLALSYPSRVHLLLYESQSWYSERPNRGRHRVRLRTTSCHAYNIVMLTTFFRVWPRTWVGERFLSYVADAFELV